MRVSQYFRLNKTQPSLDFVDVDVTRDAAIFVDPRALRLLQSDWADECVALVQAFFRHVLKCIDVGNHLEAQAQLSALREPNETHLGLSRDQSRGRAIGNESARNVWDALRESEAAKTGLLEDLEDTVLMVEGIAADIVSDITTNLIRSPLIAYTQMMCQQLRIPLTPDVNSGPLWDLRTKRWSQRFTELPITNSDKLLLVPKAIVRKRLDYDLDEYYRHYLLEEMKYAELSANTELVQLLKNGNRRVTKKSLIEKYGATKSDIVDQTRRHPSALTRYRDDKRNRVAPPMDHIAMSESQGTPEPDWQTLYKAVSDTEIGHNGAGQFEDAIESLLTALFYPALTNPQSQREIHEGRKRIDISFTNMATEGFFRWLSQHYPAPHVFVECKNYRKEPGNPELDQLSGRFSPSRGKFGILICRQFANKHAFLRRCKDTAQDDRGFIVALDDDDLKVLITERSHSSRALSFSLIQKRFEELTH